MTSEQLYYQLHLLLNKNNSQKNINIEKPHFVELFNREYNKWLYQILDKKNKDNSINDVQELLLSEVLIIKEEVKENFDVFLMPDDFFNYSECKIKAEKEKCIKNLFVYDIHPKEINVYMQDEFSKPSFEWEETICSISNNRLYIYKNNFEIKKCYLSYYKSPDNIDLEGYINLNGEYSKNIDIVLSDVYKNQILDRVAKEINREFENTTGFQLAQERLND